jgi:hypothetical protein
MIRLRLQERDLAALVAARAPVGLDIALAPGAIVLGYRLGLPLVHVRVEPAIEDRALVVQLRPARARSGIAGRARDGAARLLWRLVHRVSAPALRRWLTREQLPQSALSLDDGGPRAGLAGRARLDLPLFEAWLARRAHALPVRLELSQITIDAGVLELRAEVRDRAMSEDAGEPAGASGS